MVLDACMLHPYIILACVITHIIKEAFMPFIESTQYHTIAITVRSEINNGDSRSAIKRKNTVKLDKIAEELPTLYTVVDLRVEPHHYVDTHEETDG